MEIDSIITKIEKKEAVIGIIGLGYVARPPSVWRGLPLALCFAEKGFRSIGFDIDETKIRSLEDDQSYIKHISSQRVEKARRDEHFCPTSDFSKLSNCDAILIAVPTPLSKNREPECPKGPKVRKDSGDSFGGSLRESTQYAVVVKNRYHDQFSKLSQVLTA